MEAWFVFVEISYSFNQLLKVTSNVAYTLSTWHTTVEKYSSARIRDCTFSVYSVLFFYIFNL